MTKEDEDIVEAEVRTLTIRPDSDPVPIFAISLEEAKKRWDEFNQFVTEQMVEGKDFGRIPGVQKPTLLKPGAEKLCNIFAFTPHFEEIRTVEDWDKPLFHYVVRCVLTNKRTGVVEADCIASCNSWEERYRYRWAERECPNCKKASVIKGKEEYGGGWVCFKKKGGCGTRFDDGDEAIENQPVGKVENKDPFTIAGTILKMAEKRALVGATLNATRASDFFTQDVEDLPSESLPVVSKEPKEEGNFITVGGKKYPADGKISQEWFDRLRQRISEAGMVEPHVKNHLKKHYNAERINDLTYTQAMAFGKHLKELRAQKPEEQKPAEDDPSRELTEEDGEPYAIPQDILDEAKEIEFDVGEFVALHVPPDIPVDENVQGLLRKVVQGLKVGGNVEALGENFNKQLRK